MPIRRDKDEEETVSEAPTKFVVTGTPVKTKAAKKRDANKGKEPWRFKLVSGKAHPDNKPPVTIIAEASDEAKEKYEASINAEREKQFAPGADWRDLEGGEPPEQEEDEDKEKDNDKNGKRR